MAEFGGAGSRLPAAGGIPDTRSPLPAAGCQLLTEDASLVCAHVLGTVGLAPRQDLVTIAHRKVLVETDPESRPISHCPNVSPTIKPCQHTLRVQTGYADWLRVDGRRICLATVTGLTDGTPPGAVKYHVVNPGQGLVTEQG